VRPGLTGLAQVSGRNYVGWDRRLDLDVRYAERITFWGDLQIILRTVRSVLSQEDVAVDTDTTEQYLDLERKGKA
jgi:lipopolysaccharide/colanic/teichoic acid biosynthesis glycosyltransferase